MKIATLPAFALSFMLSSAPVQADPFSIDDTNYTREPHCLQEDTFIPDTENSHHSILKSELVIFDCQNRRFLTWTCNKALSFLSDQLVYFRDPNAPEKLNKSEQERIAETHRFSALGSLYRELCL